MYYLMLSFYFFKNKTSTLCWHRMVQSFINKNIYIKKEFTLKSTLKGILIFSCEDICYVSLLFTNNQ